MWRTQINGEKLFRNDTDAYVVWFNEIQRNILVSLFDKNGTLIQKYQACFMEYIVVPSGGTIYFVKDL